MITCSITEDPATGDRTVVVKVPRRDLIEIDLDPFDRAVLAEPERTAADVLQTLQLLAFRQQQQREKAEAAS